MHIVITGATGFLGGKITERFAAHPNVTSILATGRILKKGNQVHSPKVAYTLGDLEDLYFTKTLFDRPIDVLINCASKSAPWGTSEEFYSANITTQKNLLNASKTHGVKRFIYISSPSIYFNFKDQINIEENDTLPATGVNHYAQTKIKAEQILQKSGIEYITLRPRAIIGAGDTVIMPRLLRSYINNTLKIIGNGENIVDLTPVQNVVDAIWLACTTSAQNCNTAYNISNGKGTKLWPEINNMLKKLGHSTIQNKLPYAVVYALAWLMELRSWVTKKEPALTRYSVGTLAYSFTFNIAKARKNLGYAPRQTVDEAINEFVIWHKNTTQ